MSMLSGKNFSTGMSLFVLAVDTGTVAWEEVLPESLKSNELRVLSTRLLLFWVLEKSQAYLPYISLFFSQ